MPVPDTQQLYNQNAARYQSIWGSLNYIEQAHLRPVSESFVGNLNRQISEQEWAQFQSQVDSGRAQLEQQHREQFAGRPYAEMYDRMARQQAAQTQASAEQRQIQAQAVELARQAAGYETQQQNLSQYYKIQHMIPEDQRIAFHQQVIAAGPNDIDWATIGGNVKSAYLDRVNQQRQTMLQSGKVETPQNIRYESKFVVDVKDQQGRITGQQYYIRGQNGGVYEVTRENYNRANYGVYRGSARGVGNNPVYKEFAEREAKFQTEFAQQPVFVTSGPPRNIRDYIATGYRLPQSFIDQMYNWETGKTGAAPDTWSPSQEVIAKYWTQLRDYRNVIPDSLIYEWETGYKADDTTHPLKDNWEPSADATRRYRREMEGRGGSIVPTSVLYKYETGYASDDKDHPMPVDWKPKPDTYTKYTAEHAGVIPTTQIYEWETGYKWDDPTHPMPTGWKPSPAQIYRYETEMRDYGFVLPTSMIYGLETSTPGRRPLPISVSGPVDGGQGALDFYDRYGIPEQVVERYRKQYLETGSVRGAQPVIPKNMVYVEATATSPEKYLYTDETGQIVEMSRGDYLYYMSPRAWSLSGDKLNEGLNEVSRQFYDRDYTVAYDSAIRRYIKDNLPQQEQTLQLHAFDNESKSQIFAEHPDFYNLSEVERYKILQQQYEKLTPEQQRIYNDNMFNEKVAMYGVDFAINRNSQIQRFYSFDADTQKKILAENPTLLDKTGSEINDILNKYQPTLSAEQRKTYFEGMQTKFGPAAYDLPPEMIEQARRNITDAGFVIGVEGWKKIGEDLTATVKEIDEAEAKEMEYYNTYIRDNTVLTAEDKKTIYDTVIQRGVTIPEESFKRIKDETDRYLESIRPTPGATPTPTESVVTQYGYVDGPTIGPNGELGVEERWWEVVDPEYVRAEMERVTQLRQESARMVELAEQTARIGADTGIYIDRDSFGNIVGGVFEGRYIEGSITAQTLGRDASYADLYSLGMSRRYTTSQGLENMPAEISGVPIAITRNVYSGETYLALSDQNIRDIQAEQNRNFANSIKSFTAVTDETGKQYTRVIVPFDYNYLGTVATPTPQKDQFGGSDMSRILGVQLGAMSSPFKENKPVETTPMWQLPDALSRSAGVAIATLIGLGGSAVDAVIATQPELQIVARAFGRSDTTNPVGMMSQIQWEITTGEREITGVPTADYGFPRGIPVLGGVYVVGSEVGRAFGVTQQPIGEIGQMQPGPLGDVTLRKAYLEQQEKLMQERARIEQLVAEGRNTPEDQARLNQLQSTVDTLHDQIYGPGGFEGIMQGSITIPFTDTKITPMTPQDVTNWVTERYEGEKTFFGFTSPVKTLRGLAPEDTTMLYNPTNVAQGALDIPVMLMGFAGLAASGLYYTTARGLQAGPSGLAADIVAGMWVQTKELARNPVRSATGLVGGILAGEAVMPAVRAVTGVRFINEWEGTPYLRETIPSRIVRAMGGEGVSLIAEGGAVRVRGISIVDPITSLKIELGMKPNWTRDSYYSTIIRPSEKLATSTRLVPKWDSAGMGEIQRGTIIKAPTFSEVVRPTMHTMKLPGMYVSEVISPSGSRYVPRMSETGEISFVEAPRAGLSLPRIEKYTIGTYRDNVAAPEYITHYSLTIGKGDAPAHIAGVSIKHSDVGFISKILPGDTGIFRSVPLKDPISGDVVSRMGGFVSKGITTEGVPMASAAGKGTFFTYRELAQMSTPGSRWKASVGTPDFLIREAYIEGVGEGPVSLPPTASGARLFTPMMEKFLSREGVAGASEFFKMQMDLAKRAQGIEYSRIADPYAIVKEFSWASRGDVGKALLDTIKQTDQDHLIYGTFAGRAQSRLARSAADLDVATNFPVRMAETIEAQLKKTHGDKIVREDTTIKIQTGVDKFGAPEYKTIVDVHPLEDIHTGIAGELEYGFSTKHPIQVSGINMISYGEQALNKVLSTMSLYPTESGWTTGARPWRYKDYADVVAIAREESTKYGAGSSQRAIWEKYASDYLGRIRGLSEEDASLAYKRLADYGITKDVIAEEFAGVGKKPNTPGEPHAIGTSVIEKTPYYEEIPGEVRIIEKTPGQDYRDVTDVFSHAPSGQHVKIDGEYIKLKPYRPPYQLIEKATTSDVLIPETTRVGKPNLEFDPFGTVFGDRETVPGRTVTVVDKFPTKVSSWRMDPEMFRTHVLREGYIPDASAAITIPAIQGLLEREGRLTAKEPKTPYPIILEGEIIGEKAAFNLARVYDDVRTGKITTAEMFDRQIAAMEAIYETTRTRTVVSPYEVIARKEIMNTEVRTGNVDYIEKILPSIKEKYENLAATKYGMHGAEHAEAVFTNLMQIRESTPALQKYSPQTIRAIAYLHDIAKFDIELGTAPKGYIPRLSHGKVSAEALVRGYLDEFDIVRALTPEEKGIAATAIAEHERITPKTDIGQAVKYADQLDVGRFGTNEVPVYSMEEIGPHTNVKLYPEFGVSIIEKGSRITGNPATPMKFAPVEKTTIGKLILDTLRDEFPEHKMGGSFAQATQSKFTRMWEDIDLYVQNEAQTKYRLREILLPHAETFEAAGIKLSKIFDIHGLPEVGSPIGRFGIPTEKTISVEGINIMSIREQVMRKATNIATMRNTGDEWYTGVEPHRGKDIADTLGGMKSTAYDLFHDKTYERLTKGPVASTGEPIIDTAEMIPHAIGDIYYGSKLRKLESAYNDLLEMLSDKYMPKQKPEGADKVYDPLKSAVQRLAKYHTETPETIYDRTLFGKWVPEGETIPGKISEGARGVGGAARDIIEMEKDFFTTNGGVVKDVLAGEQRPRRLTPREQIGDVNIRIDRLGIRGASELAGSKDVVLSTLEEIRKIPLAQEAFTQDVNIVIGKRHGSQYAPENIWGATSHQPPHKMSTGEIYLNIKDIERSPQYLVAHEIWHQQGTADVIARWKDINPDVEKTFMDMPPLPHVAERMKANRDYYSAGFDQFGKKFDVERIVTHTNFDETMAMLAGRYVSSKIPFEESIAKITTPELAREYATRFKKLISVYERPAETTALTSREQIVIKSFALEKGLTNIEREKYSDIFDVTITELEKHPLVETAFKRPVDVEIGKQKGSHYIPGGSVYLSIRDLDTRPREAIAHEIWHQQGVDGVIKKWEAIGVDRETTLGAFGDLPEMPHVFNFMLATRRALLEIGDTEEGIAPWITRAKFIETTAILAGNYIGVDLRPLEDTLVKMDFLKKPAGYLTKEERIPVAKEYADRFRKLISVYTPPPETPKLTPREQPMYPSRVGEAPTLESLGIGSRTINFTPAEMDFYIKTIGEEVELAEVHKHGQVVFETRGINQPGKISVDISGITTKVPVQNLASGEYQSMHSHVGDQTYMALPSAADIQGFIETDMRETTFNVNLGTAVVIEPPKEFARMSFEERARIGKTVSDAMRRFNQEVETTLQKQYVETGMRIEESVYTRLQQTNLENAAIASGMRLKYVTDINVATGVGKVIREVVGEKLSQDVLKASGVTTGYLTPREQPEGVTYLKASHVADAKVTEWLDQLLAPKSSRESYTSIAISEFKFDQLGLGGDTIVALFGEKVVGAGSIRPVGKDILFVETLGSMMKGVGTGLIDEITKVGLEGGFKKIQLFPTSEAKRFYDKVGFTPEGMRLSKMLTPREQPILTDEVAEFIKRSGRNPDIVEEVLNEFVIGAPAVNEFLRGKHVPTPAGEYVAHIATNIDILIAPLEKQMKLYRGVSGETGADIGLNANKNDIIIDTGFSSFTTDVGIANRFATSPSFGDPGKKVSRITNNKLLGTVLNLDLEKGAPAYVVSYEEGGFGSYESEVILPRGIILEIEDTWHTRVGKLGELKNIDVKIIPEIPDNFTGKIFGAKPVQLTPREQPRAKFLQDILTRTPELGELNLEDVVGWHTTTGAFKSNLVLRNNPLADKTPEVMQHISGMDKIFDILPDVTTGIDIYRGVGGKTGAKLMSRGRVGDIISDTGFLSFSKDIRTAGWFGAVSHDDYPSGYIGDISRGVIVKTNLTRGKAIEVEYSEGDWQHSEQEVILPRGSLFKISDMQGILPVFQI